MLCWGCYEAGFVGVVVGWGCDKRFVGGVVKHAFWGWVRGDKARFVRGLL